MGIVSILLFAGCSKPRPPESWTEARLGVEPSPEVRRFPWPPPAASATVRLPRTLLEGNRPFKTLHDVDAALQAGLRQTGYFDTSYLWVQGGFALVTQLERIGKDGAPRYPDRFSVKSARVDIAHFSLGDYLRALFTANPSRYRVIAFIVTDVPFVQADRRVTPDEAAAWLHGSSWLPEKIGGMPWTSQVECTVLIYEFIREQQQAPRMLNPDEGALDGLTHLRGAGLWNPKVFTTPELPR